MDTKQLEAIRIAEWLEGIRGNTWPSYIPQEAAAELRRLQSENEQLRAGYDAARQEIASLKAKNLELERVCDATYVTQGADAYNHACSMMERYQAEREAARKEVGAEGSLCDGISWLYTRIASLESQLEAVATPAQPLHVAATSCPHEIDKDKIVLHFDSKQPGKNALAQLAARLQAAQAQAVPAPGVEAVSERELKQFLSDVLTAAGLVTHGKKCKDLGRRLGEMSMRLLTAPKTAAAPVQALAAWNPIETAPKDKSNVVLLRQPCGSVANGYFLAEAYAGNGAWIWPYIHKTPTHWMPLPAPPAAIAAQKGNHD